MQTPQDTLLVVLQVVSLMLTLLMAVTAWQTRQRKGATLWIVAFATGAVSQWLREGAATLWGHIAGLPFGHLGGPLAYGLLYIGVRRYLELPERIGFVACAFAIAALLSLGAVSQDLAFGSLAMTATVAAMFQAMTAATFGGVWKGDGGVARVVAAAIFAISAVASLVRALSIVPAWHPGNGPQHANLVWLLAFIALDILQAGSLMFLVNQSLLDELQNMADFDPLTGLLNRRGLSRRMKRGRGRPGTAKRSGMLCMDLDHFKAINDVHGHGAGDDVLRRVGQLIRDNSRPQDTPVRQGGEEFVLIVEAASDEELCALAERHRAAVEREMFATRAGPVPVTISIGAALAGDAGESLDEIGERADQALLAAKRAGRNRVVLSPPPSRR